MAVRPAKSVISKNNVYLCLSKRNNLVTEMKTRNFAILLCTALAVACSPSEKELKMMSFNVNNGVGIDSVLNFQRAADIILAQAPDVVAVQKLDSMTARFPHFALGELAGKTSMNGAYAAAAAIEGGSTGVGILSKEKPVKTYSVKLPGGDEGSILFVAEFKKYVFGCVTMSRAQGDQISSIAILKEEAAKAGKPFFFGGSLNARYGSQTISSLARDFTPLANISGRTYPADKPVALVDYLFMYNRNIRSFSVDSVAVLNEPLASTHRPVIAKVSFR